MSIKVGYYNNTETTKKVFNNISDKQDEKGLKKYGKPINPLDDYNWNDMAIEELVDSIKYVVANKKKTELTIDKVVKELEAIRYDILFGEKVNKNGTSVNLSYCIEQLNKLKGGRT